MKRTVWKSYTLFSKQRQADLPEDLRGKELDKIDCGHKSFDVLDGVEFMHIDDYDELMESI